MKENILARDIRLLGYTQEQLAKKMGISVNSFSIWITGRRLISGKMVRRLLKEGISKEALSNPTKEIEV